MFGEFTVPAAMHDAVYFDLLDAGYVEVEVQAKEEQFDFELEML